MFHPRDTPLERGWVGRVEGDRVLHLAAQTLQSFFLGGGRAREHAAYPLAEVTFLAPVLHPPTVRLFERSGSFAFANATAVTGPHAEVRSPAGALSLQPRLAAVVGAGGQIGGFTLLAEWLAPARDRPKDRDFALVIGPVVVTPDELDPASVSVEVVEDGATRLDARAHAIDWEQARDSAEDGTALRPGDILGGPPVGVVAEVAGPVELRAAILGVLAQTAT